MPGAQGNECRKCLSIHHQSYNCDYQPYLWNKNNRCGCNYIQPHGKVNTHCCKCKKPTAIYKLNTDYHCRECQEQMGLKPRTTAYNLRNYHGSFSTDGNNAQTRVIFRQITKPVENEYKFPVTYSTGTCEYCNRSAKRTWNELTKLENGSMICSKCLSKKEDSDRYGSTTRIDTCEVCGTTSNTLSWIERGNIKYPFCELRCQVIFLAVERSKNDKRAYEDDNPQILYEKCASLAYGKPYNSYPEFMEITTDEIQEIVDECITYIHKGSKRNKPAKTLEETREIFNEMETDTQIPLPNEIRNMIVEEAYEHDKFSITNKFDDNYPKIMELNEQQQSIEEESFYNNNDILEQDDNIYGTSLYTTALPINTTEEELEIMWNKTEVQETVQETTQIWEDLYSIDQGIQLYYNPTQESQEREQCPEQQFKPNYQTRRHSIELTKGYTESGTYNYYTRNEERDLASYNIYYLTEQNNQLNGDIRLKEFQLDTFNGQMGNYQREIQDLKDQIGKQADYPRQIKEHRELVKQKNEIIEQQAQQICEAITNNEANCNTNQKISGALEKSKRKVNTADKTIGNLSDQVNSLLQENTRIKTRLMRITSTKTTETQTDVWNSDNEKPSKRRIEWDLTNDEMIIEKLQDTTSQEELTQGSIVTTPPPLIGGQTLQQVVEEVIGTNVTKVQKTQDKKEKENKNKRKSPKEILSNLTKKFKKSKVTK